MFHMFSVNISNKTEITDDLRPNNSKTAITIQRSLQSITTRYAYNYSIQHATLQNDHSDQETQKSVTNTIYSSKKLCSLFHLHPPCYSIYFNPVQFYQQKLLDHEGTSNKQISITNRFEYMSDKDIAITNRFEYMSDKDIAIQNRYI